MRRLIVVSALPAGLLMLAAAAPVPTKLEPAFGGTIVSTYPDGRTAELWLDRSGGYTAMGRRKDRSSGHWKVSGEKICLKQSRPFPAPFSFCTPLPSGETWSAKAVTGEPIRVKLVRGRAGGRD